MHLFGNIMYYVHAAKPTRQQPAIDARTALVATQAIRRRHRERSEGNRTPTFRYLFTGATFKPYLINSLFNTSKMCKEKVTQGFDIHGCYCQPPF